MLCIAWRIHVLMNLAYAITLSPTSRIPYWFYTFLALFDVLIAAMCVLPKINRTDT